MVSQHLIGDSEDLGRCCFDSRDARRHRPRTRFIRRSFDRQGLMSVDRLENADVHALRRLHDAEGMERRPTPRTFHGWYVFSAGAVRNAGWDVRPDPTTNNPWHSQVHLSDSSDEEDAFIESCQKIASQSWWKDPPMSQDTEDFLEQVTEPLD